MCISEEMIQYLYIFDANTEAQQSWVCPWIRQNTLLNQRLDAPKACGGLDQPF